MCFNPKKCNVALVLAMLLWAGKPFRGQPRTDTAVVINLREHGWEPPSRYQYDKPSITVDNEGRVLVGFTVQARGGLVTRNAPSLDFRILRFTSEGKLDLSVSLPTRMKSSNGIYVSDTDQVIARANDRLELLEANDGEGVWKVLCAQWCGVLQSPTRHTLVLLTKRADPPARIMRFSQKPVLQPCASASQSAQSRDDKIEIKTRSITDEFSYSYRPGPEGFAYRWPLCEPDRRVELPRTFDFVLNDGFFLTTTFTHRIGSTDQKLEVISPDGQVKFALPMLKYESVVGNDGIRGSAQGDRIAAHIVTLRGGNLTLDVGAHATSRRIVVYDMDTAREVVSIPVSLKQHYRFDFDLSPNGRHLTILEDDIVRMVDLENVSKTEVRP
jgi:hypothetical protein